MDKIFTGAHYPAAVTRVFTTEDPAQQGRKVSTRKKYDMITNLVLERVSGHGKFSNTEEEFITVSGQYAPGQTARITASAQHRDALLGMVKGKVNKDDDNKLTERVLVNVVATPMKGRGFAVQELYLVNADGSQTTIIGPAQPISAESSTEQLF